jgi:hypothetical protein
MIPILLLIALMIFTWGAAVYAGYAEPKEPSGTPPDQSQDQTDYYDAA